MILLVYLLGILASLFILYAVARHDFVLLRQSISLRIVFDNVFIGLFVFFVTARVSYAFYARMLELLNPLRFFYLTKYWGILPYIGLFGMMATILFLFRKKKNKMRIMDIYFIAMSPVILFDVLLKANTGILLLIKIVSTLVLIFFYGWFIKIHNKYSTKDGFITFLTIITYSLTSLAFSLAAYGIVSMQYLWFNAVLTIATIASGVFLFLVQRETFNKQ